MREIPLLGTAPDDELLRVRFVAFDFDGVFTDDAVYVTQDGMEMVRCWRGDGLGLRKLEQAGIGTAILSTEVNPVVGVRARKMRIRCVQGLENKLLALETLATESGIRLAHFAYVGNDINDLPCFSSVGLPVAVANAHQDVVDSVRYRTKTPGGYGAVREVCDALHRAHVSGALPHPAGESL